MTTATNPADILDAAQVRQLLRDDPDAIILDVRSGGEFENAHIPGSYNVPLDALGEHVRRLAAVDRPVVLVCKSGGRAGNAHGKLTEAGKQALHLLQGGIDAWETAGGDLVRGGDQRWAMDRQVRLVAGTISLVGILASVVAPRAKWLAGAVAGGLTFSAVTNTCALGTVLAKLPYNRGADCDIDQVLADLGQRS